MDDFEAVLGIPRDVLPFPLDLIHASKVYSLNIEKERTDPDLEWFRQNQRARKLLYLN